MARDGGIVTTIDPIVDDVTPVRVCLAAQAVNSHGVFMVHKTTQRSLYDAVAAAEPHVDDVLLWNSDGQVVESCRANVLFRIGERWFTPPLSAGGLPGVGRVALVAGGDAVERVLTVDELATVDELQLVSALRGRRAVRLVNGSE